MKEEILLGVQEICLEIYKEFKSVCDKHNLQYYGIGGTCIGAVRHNGFIPWDDDIDIAMPYIDMCKFIHIANTEMSEKYEIFTPLEHKQFGEMFIKLIKKDTTYILSINKKNPGAYTGIGIDIMPIFGLGKDKKKQSKAAKVNDFYVRMNCVMHYPFSAQKTFLGRSTWVLSQPIKRVFINSNYWLKKSIKEFSEIPFDKSDKILFAWRLMRKNNATGFYDSIFDYEDFKAYKELPFEDTLMRVPIGYDRYLKHDFGDYMTLPPKEKQIPVHDAVVVDFVKPYTDYIGKLL